MQARKHLPLLNITAEESDYLLIRTEVWLSNESTNQRVPVKQEYQYICSSTTASRNS